MTLKTRPPQTTYPESLPDFWPTIRVHLLLVVILALAVGMRFAYLGVIGHGDLQHFNAPWARTIQQEGLFRIYAFDYAVNYPPLYLIMLSLVAAVQPISNGSFYVYFDTQLLILLKLIPIVSEILLIIAVYYWLPRGNRLRWLIPVLLAVHPGLLITTPFWGQTDAILTMLLAVCLIALNRDRLLWGWVLFALAVLMKFQAIILLPMAACLSWRRYGLRRTGVGLVIGGVIIAAVMLPFVIGSGYDMAMRPFTGAVGLYPNTTLNAYNLWYIGNPVSWVVKPGLPHLWELVGDKQLLFETFTYKDVGLGMFGLYGLLILTSVWRRPFERREFVWAGALYFGFFMLPTQIHERYLYPAAVFTLIGAAQDRRFWPVALGALFTYTYNVLVVVDERFIWLGVDFVNLFGDIAIYVALLNMVLLAWAAWVAISRPTVSTVGETHASWWRREWSEKAQRRAGYIIWGGGSVAAGVLALGILVQVLSINA
jgi:Gpi18-like mannosyltransferase